MLVNPNSKLPLDMINILEECIPEWNDEIKSCTIPFRYHWCNHIPLRNLSGGIGEALAGMFLSKTNSHVENPCPDGHPDILPNNEEARPWIETPKLEDFMGEGGFDMKANIQKSGDSIDTKPAAHHRFTTSVMNVLWEERNDFPQIIGITYADDLIEDDWSIPSLGKAGSKTTNSCSVLRGGKRKLRAGWVLMEDNLRLVQPKEWLGYS